MQVIVAGGPARGLEGSAERDVDLRELARADGDLALLDVVLHPARAHRAIRARPDEIGRLPERREHDVLDVLARPRIFGVRDQIRRADRLPEAQVVLGALPGETFESIEAWLQSARDSRPRSRVATVLASRLPGAAADEWVRRAGIPADAIMAHLPRDSRRRLAHALAGTPLDVTGSRGYTFAEATAGGVPLEEIDAATMESRVCGNLFLAGEMLDVDGRLGGFNFQWAWSTGWVASMGVAEALQR